MKPISAIDRYAIKKVRGKRIFLGLSQTQLSYMLDVSPGYIRRIESDKYAMRYALLFFIFAEFGRLLYYQQFYHHLPKGKL